ncbi:carbon storage regulator CsrA [Jonesia quinghaiensis]|uniref:carbon storage regulator CsrA n=1 Tax=Jonesia quinghaiensis TaxID=262806 RepID=UPI000419B0B4|nr:carbon storage regulator CsrA [Jonesia quinghaiensis]
MLVLSRRVGEKLLIGDDVVITIIDTRGDGVRIGIDAPRSTTIHRAEVIEAVTQSNESAAVAPEKATDVRDQLLKAIHARKPAEKPAETAPIAPETESPDSASTPSSGEPQN